MNGEVIAWVVDVDGEPVDQWLLLSEDCGVRATIRQGQAFTLSPPGECLFRIAPDEERVSTEADWFRVEVIPSDTVYIEVVAPSIEPIEPDSGV